MDIQVKKRSGNIVEYDSTKIKKALKKCLKRCHIRYTNELYQNIEAAIKETNRKIISVEDVQNIIEKELMKIYPEAAKEYILYRKQKEQIREWTKSKEDFINKYKGTYNTADGTVDDNSNVSCKNIGVLNSEIHKEDNIQISRRMVSNKLKEIFPDFDHKQYERDLNNHVIYKHDESSFAGAVAPYTYSAKEVIRVKYNENILLIPFDLLYELIEEPEVCVDNIKEVYQKYPDDLYVLDRGGEWTRATTMTRKKRHKDLYRIKTSFGEDLVVTEDHPMITDIDNIENTTPAKESLNMSQFKERHALTFRGNTIIDMSDILKKGEVYDSFIRYDRHEINRHVRLTEEFGYVIGFFIGDGNYNNPNKYLNYSQKDNSILYKINDIIYRHTGVAGFVQYKPDRNMYGLELRSRALFELFKDFFKIQDKAQGKTLPINILDFNEDFAKGILEGLYDADGTANYNQLWLKLASRAAILQVSELMRHFGYSIGNGIQSLPFQNSGYTTNYSLWTIGCTKRPDCESFDMSYKWSKIGVSTTTPKYHKSGEVKITGVQKIQENDSFLLQNEYIYDITTDTHTFILNNIIVHNCVAVSMYPFLNNGIKDIGGLSAKPKNLDSYCGIFVNMIFAIASQFAGAIACGEFFLYFCYFARKEWGDDWYLHIDDIINPRSTHPRTIRDQVHQYFQQVVYSINQPAAARGMQSAFVNFSYYDKNFFDGMFGEFVFPDGTKPIWEDLNWVQKDFMQWFNEERLHCILTFPVETYAMVYKDEKFLDQESADFVAEEYARGHSFFTYISDSVDSLSSCCFIGDEIISVREDNEEFLIKISDFVNSFNNNINSSGQHIDNNIKITSFNINGNKEETEITGILKKEYTGNMYDIQINDSKICVTEDHLILVKNINSGEILQISAGELYDNIEDYLIAVDQD